MLNDWLKEQIDNIRNFLGDYGKLVLLIVSAVIIFSCLIFLNAKTRDGEMVVAFFDVGQGDSIFIQTPSGKQMLIDGGPNDKVMRGLDKEMPMFDRSIDVVVATHADADHVTGLIPVLEKYKVAHIIESPVKGKTNIFDDLEKHIANENADVHVGKIGDVIDFNDGVIATVLYPGVGERGTDAVCRGDTNECCVSILLTYLDKNFLFSCDLPSTREGKLIESGLLPHDITVYKAGHHGSKTSSGDQLLSYIKPYYSVISAGKDNRYGHPNIETLERLKKYSKVILSTIENGEVKFEMRGGGLRFEVGK